MYLFSDLFQTAAKFEFLPASIKAGFNEAANYLDHHERKSLLFPVLKRQLASGEINQEEACWMIAMSVHGTQTRRDGKPYMSHVRAVVRAPEMYADIEYTHNQKMLAIVHDCGEDSFGAWTANDFRKLGYDEEFCLGFDGITRRKNEPYFDFVERSSLTIAPPVKRGDGYHNWSDKPKKLHEQRYRITSHYLRDVIYGITKAGSSVAEWAAKEGLYDEDLFRKYSSRPIIHNYITPGNKAHMSGIQAPAAV